MQIQIQTLTLKAVNTALYKLSRLINCNSGCCYEELTIQAAGALMLSEKVVPGKKYKITGVHRNKPGAAIPTLYDDGTDPGITIYVEGLTTNTFSSHGYGEFWIPKYDRENYGIADPDGLWSVVVLAGGSGYSDDTEVAVTTAGDGVGMTVDITTSGGVITGVVINNLGSDYGPGEVLTVTGGDGNATLLVRRGLYLYNIWDGDNPDPNYYPTYAQDRKLIWGPYMWTNLNGNTGTAINANELDPAEWEKVPYNTTDYLKVTDYIEYDWANDWILRRKQEDSNIDVIFLYNNRDNSSSLDLHGISVMHWGYPYSVNTGYGLSGLIVENGYAELINFKGKAYQRLKVMNGSRIKGNYYGGETEFGTVQIADQGSQTNMEYWLTVGTITQEQIYISNFSSQDSLVFKMAAYQRQIHISDGASQQDYTLDYACYQFDVHVSSNSQQSGLIFRRTIEVPFYPFQEHVYITNNSVQNNVTLDSSYQKKISISNSSYMYDTLIEQGSYQEDIILDNESGQGDLVITNGAHQKNIELRHEANQIDATISSSQENISYDNYTGTSHDKTASPESDSYYYNNENVFYFRVDFSGGLGAGVVGSVQIPDLYLNADFFISRVEVKASGLTAGITAAINLGIETEDTISGLDDTTGLVASINNLITIYSNLNNTQATSSRKLVMAVTNDDITAGTVWLKVITSKL